MINQVRFVFDGRFYPLPSFDESYITRFLIVV